MLWLVACSDYTVEKAYDHAGDTGCLPDAPAYGVATEEDCAFAPPVGSWTPVVEWQWSASTLAPGFDEVMMMPAVGDVTGDGLPDIVFTAYANPSYSSPGALIILSGTGEEEAAFTDIGGFAPSGSGGVALGDIDADGTPEIVVMSADARVLVLHADGSLVWASAPSGVQSIYGYPALADLDEDGRAEVIAGAAIYDSAGNLTGTGGYGMGSVYAIPVVADLDLDGVQEVIVGNAAYHKDGSALWYSGTGDGYPAVADFDGDGLGEVVTVWSGSLWMTDTDGTVRWTQATIPGGGGGPPTVADFDGDGAPEIGVAGLSGYAVYEADGTMVWSEPTQDASSAQTGSSVFDFEGDGKAEVVYADELTLWGYDGGTGAPILAEEGHSSWTLFEYPTIADIDADGQAEIVLASNDSINTGWRGITVIGDASASWSAVAPVWNQHAYAIDNVNDDLSIPASPLPNWLTGSNTFRAGGRQDGVANPAPNLSVVISELCGPCGTDTTDVVFFVENAGLEDVLGDVVVDLYGIGDDGARRLLTTETVTGGVPAGASSAATMVSLPSARLEKVVFLVAAVDGADIVRECDEADNETRTKLATCE